MKINLYQSLVQSFWTLVRKCKWN